jgi:hypothetical protein
MLPASAGLADRRGSTPAWSRPADEVAYRSAPAATLATALVRSCKRRVQRLTRAADAREMSGYGVYVIELKGRPVPHAICSVYVGSSWLPPSERQKQHHDGHATGARGLQGNTRRLRPEL